ncbi:serine/threonine-protein kinase [Iningainema tapete]|uniref:non-specific serine/threonine protein kinase n=1 Tax=Iningainema tapete BLCC-T55 TaxID=2748662 RepID=A0A8J6XF21_9CYAN|nr:serine/threonine-protein kinase [Iningainema tapete]MBD2771610.1 serine/threonine protein kinase [Iningainema tapete BLCC-T55]
MSYCLNPNCPKPHNTNDGKFCLTCGSKLLLKERYRAIKPIGQGGFGRTFLAVDEDKPSKPRCVIKQFYPRIQGNSPMQKAEELFTQEAMRLDELGKHPQIPELLAYFIQDNRQYLVQEFIDGQNLAQELSQKGAFSETEIYKFLQELLPLLLFCHNKKVIHRDIKPENIIRRRLPQILESGGTSSDIVLVDFGAAKFVTHTALTITGTTIGSPEFVAPEQSKGKAVFASDIYSLGATCIHLLTQRSPFDLYDINQDAWIWEKYLKNPVSEQLIRILNKMLENALSKRYQTVDEVLQDLNYLTAKTVKPTHTNSTQTNFPTQAKSQIDRELEEMKTMFLNNSKPKSNINTGSTTQKSQPISKSKIDEELEELRAKYKNNE